MPVETNPYEVAEIPRRVMPLIFMVDTSASMEGAKIASLNTAAREALNEVGEISQNNADAKIKIGVLDFNSGVNWMYPQLTDAEQFVWQDLSTAGMTSLGAAINELNNKLSQSHGYMIEPKGTRAPAIILMSDGDPTDEYKQPLVKIKGNKWFNHACKIAIAIGNDANKQVLAEFTGNPESVITVHNVDQLKKIIRTASVTSTMVNSNPNDNSGANGPVKDATQKTIDNIKQNDPTINTGIGPDLDPGADFFDSYD